MEIGIGNREVAGGLRIFLIDPDVINRSPLYFMLADANKDTFSGGGVEEYDSSNQLYRLVNSVVIPQYDGYGVDSGGACFYYDLQTGQLAYQASPAGSGAGWRLLPSDKSDLYYSPEALAGEGIR